MKITLQSATAYYPGAHLRRLGSIQPDHWLAEYTTELINMLNVLGLLVDLEPAQAKLLDRVCVGSLIPREEIHVLESFVRPKRSRQEMTAPTLFDMPED